MSPGVNPTAELRRLRAELRRLREASGLTQQQVADTLEWSLSKVIRIETGVVGVSHTDLRALLFEYEVEDGAEIERLAVMARASRQEGWWTKYRPHFTRRFITFVGLEASASHIRQYQQLVIPGLLQTREYAKAVLEVWESDASGITLGTEVRLGRQRVLTEGGPRMSFIVDEGAVRRQVGGVTVMRDQLERVREVSRWPNVSFRVVPFDRGAHKGMKESFQVLEFASDDDDFAVYVDGFHNTALLQNSPEEASDYLQTFYDIEKIALPEAEMGAFFDDVFGQMR